ncbi:hypothetical protein GN244_ATG01770 [Phytophthora infestans]|uniref:Uncharacterized protein n=1 Tax=Phytophthora infestans TaxID=4787 RepID=A0A833T1M0_PHYIN|nr:hypothetical protein GN244_ATG01770 [Phytophthora infestans]KAF4136571.1 hypothetical protein GN958_ATG14246 [Phytophthora infestans]
MFGSDDKAEDAGPSGPLPLSLSPPHKCSGVTTPYQSFFDEAKPPPAVSAGAVSALAPSSIPQLRLPKVRPEDDGVLPSESAGGIPFESQGDASPLHFPADDTADQEDVLPPIADTSPLRGSKSAAGMPLAPSADIPAGSASPVKFRSSRRPDRGASTSHPPPEERLLLYHL